MVVTARLSKVHALAAAAALLLAACGGAAPPGVSGGASASAAKPAASASAPAGASSATPAASSSAQAKPGTSGGDKITVVYNSPDSGYLPLWVGQDTDIFQKHGLTVDLQLVSNGNQSMAALLSGQVQFVQSGGSAALSPAADGADLTVLTTIIPVYSYLLESTPDIKTPADLKGKKLGVSSFGDSSDLATRYSLKKLGIDPDKDVSILAIGGTPVRAAALRGGSIQAAVASFPENLALEKDGFRRIMDMASLKIPAAGQSTIAQKSWVASHRDVTQRYVDSLIEALGRLKSDRAGTLAIMKKWTKLDDDQALAATYDYYTLEVFPAVPDPNPTLFADSVATLAKTNDKVASVDLSKLLDGSFVKSAVDRGLTKS